MAHHLALAAHVGLLGAEEAVGVDLHLEAAVAEDTLGDHGHHVNALRLGAHDEGCRLVVRIGRGRSHARHKDLLGPQEIARPRRRRGGGHAIALCIFRGLGMPGKRHQRGLARIQRLAQQDDGVHTHQHASLVGIAVARASPAFGDLTQHRARIALYLGHIHALIAGPGALQHLRQLRRVHAGQSIGLGVFSHRGPIPRILSNACTRIAFCVALP